LIMLTNSLVSPMEKVGSEASDMIDDSDGFLDADCVCV
jgi:hypothetical protein